MPSPSGKAVACKATIPSSNLGSSSIILLSLIRDTNLCPGGGMVDTGDLKSPDYCNRAGSSPAPGTTLFLNKSYKHSGDVRVVECAGLENR